MNQIRNRVLALVKRGAFTEAVTAAADFARRNPEMAESYALLAQAEDVAGYTKAAIKSVSKAIALAPYEPAYLFQRGRLHFKINAASDALKDMEHVLEIGHALSAEYREVVAAHRDEALRRLQQHSGAHRGRPNSGAMAARSSLG